MHATRIIAIRHGETAWNVDTRIQGQLDIGLNERGFWQARRVAQALAGESIQAIYASDLSRAWDTASAIAQVSGHTPVAHQGLRERGFGILQGQIRSDIDANWPEDSRRWHQRDPHWAPQDGESLVTMRERILRVTNELAAQHPGEQIVLVAHGGVMDLLYRLATGQDLQAPRSWQLGNAAINRLLWTPEGLTLVGWSDTRHLDEPSRDESTA
jgi:2,3-bisphosphoglycerate-dependent phosphoglycerate mutase